MYSYFYIKRTLPLNIINFYMEIIGYSYTTIIVMPILINKKGFQKYMEGYIRDITLGNWRGLKSLNINFSGYNYRYPGFYEKDLLEFREDYLKPIREVEGIIDELSINTDIAIFGGGEPTLQRQVLLRLVRHTKELGITNILFTNATKPFVIRDILSFVKILVIELPAPLNKKFGKVTKAGTFFYPIEEVIKDIKNSMEILKKTKDVGIIVRTKVIPGLMYKIEDFIDIAKEIKGINCSWEIVKFEPQRTIYKTFQGVNKPTTEFIEKIIENIKKKYPFLNVNRAEY